MIYRFFYVDAYENVHEKRFKSENQNWVFF